MTNATIILIHIDLQKDAHVCYTPAEVVGYSEPWKTYGKFMLTNYDQ